ncbi:unnamed protein product [Cuscuta campestris]|uniref:Uncharacterized protein n=1 Tax=Cuscuta campestris TaxID=132261 RepID=A0A484LZR7_9ASTE|nr:unnamed protein product [Cuscuta campestris]
MAKKGEKGSGNPIPPTPPNVRNLRNFLHGIEDDVGTTAETFEPESGVEGDALLVGNEKAKAGGVDGSSASPDSLSCSPSVDEEAMVLELEKKLQKDKPVIQDVEDVNNPATGEVTAKDGGKQQTAKDVNTPTTDEVTAKEAGKQPNANDSGKTTGNNHVTNKDEKSV